MIHTRENFRFESEIFVLNGLKIALYLPVNVFVSWTVY